MGTLSGQNQTALCSNANHCTGGLCGLFQPVHVNLVFWRTLYLPEIQQHARYLAMELEILNNPDLHLYHKEQEVDIDTWLKNRIGIEYVTNPAEYPNVKDKVIAEFFTNQIETKLAKELRIEQATVYFQFKPSPRIWIQTPEMNGNWVREPLKTYANYSPELILGWLLGTPLIAGIIILTLVRQLNVLYAACRMQQTAIVKWFRPLSGYQSWSTGNPSGESCV